MTSQVQPSQAQASQAQALDVADQVIQNVMATRSVASAVPTAVDLMYQQQVAQHNQQVAQQGAQLANRAGKEATSSLSIDAANIQTANIEAATGIQVVEQEKNPELPVEVEGFLQHIESNSQQAPQEIVLVDLQNEAFPAKVPKKSVIVLPITPEIEKTGAKKSPKHSIRWLIEWSRKIMKMFQGTVVYRPVEKSE
jgi:hypothetical protein